MELKILILLHVLGACIWVGGHLVLAVSVLPKAWKEKNPEGIRVFEERFERIGIPALLLQLVTGLRMAGIYMNAREWFSFEDRMHATIAIKLILIAITLLLAIHARLFIIPRLNPENIRLLGWHIIAITMVSLVQLFVGVNLRLGVL